MKLYIQKKIGKELKDCDRLVSLFCYTYLAAKTIKPEYIMIFNRFKREGYLFDYTAMERTLRLGHIDRPDFNILFKIKGAARSTRIILVCSRTTKPANIFYLRF